MTRLLYRRIYIGIALLGLVLGLNLSFGIGSGPSAHPEISVGVERVHSVETTNWISGFIHSPHGISSAAHFSTPPHKNPYQGFSAINKSPLAFTSFTFLANPYFLHQIIVRLPHTGFIFPFHFFW